MSEPLRFVVPMPPNMANGRMHHMVKHRVKVGYWALLDWIVFHRLDLKAMTWLAAHAKRSKGALASDLQRLCDVNPLKFPFCDQPAAPAAPLGRVTVRSVMVLGGAMDDDNAIARHKWVLDWLKSRGFITDDRKAFLSWESLPAQIVNRSGAYRIELTVSPL